MVEYSIGPSTWGHPIVWQREWGSAQSWQGSNIRDPRDLDPDTVTNWADFAFALQLQNICRVGDWIYNVGYMKTAGWYQVTRVDAWCAHVGWDVVTFLNVAAHADASKDAVTFRASVQWQDKIRWKLYGF